MSGTMFRKAPINAAWLPSAEGVGAAFAAVIAGMPEGWYFKALQFIPDTSKRAHRSGRGAYWQARATRRGDLGLPSAAFDGIGATPTEALTKLAGAMLAINQSKAHALANGEEWKLVGRAALQARTEEPR